MKALIIDGMGAPAIVWAYLAPIIKLNGGETVYSQWQDWQQHQDADWDIVIGHSLGGDSAIQLCNARSQAAQPKLLMALGARHQSAASWFDLLFPLGIQGFAAPNKVTHNFYTYPPLPSQPIVGAVENVNVSSVLNGIWHGNIPSAPQVQACLKNFLKGQK